MPATNNEEVFVTKELYGLTIKDMQIDFNSKAVSFEVTKRIVFALDYPLLPDRVFVRATNPNFKFIVNQLNRDLFTFDKVCITSENEMIYATMSEPAQK